MAPPCWIALWEAPASRRRWAKEERRIRIRLRDRAVQRPHLHRIARRRLEIRARREEGLGGFAPPEEARQAERLEAVRRERIDERRNQGGERAHAFVCAERARFEDVEIVAAAGKYARDLLTTEVDRKADDWDARFVAAASETRIDTERGLDAREIPGANRRNEAS